jgi:hypothetical protein
MHVALVIHVDEVLNCHIMVHASSKSLLASQNMFFSHPGARFGSYFLILISWSLLTDMLINKELHLMNTKFL